MNKKTLEHTNRHGRNLLSFPYKLRFRLHNYIPLHMKLVLIISILFLGYFIVGLGHGICYSEEYVCRHMSRDIEDGFESIGIQVQLVRGTDKNNNGHMWINIFGIDFDSVWLLPVIGTRYAYPDNIKQFNDWSEYLVWKGLDE